MVTLKLNDLLTISNTFSSYPLQSMPSKLAYRVAKILRKIGQEANDFEKVRIALVEKYSSEAGDQPDAVRKVPDDKIEAFKAELTQILSEDVTVDIQPIPWDLVYSSGMTVGMIAVLDPLVEAPLEAQPA